MEQRGTYMWNNLTRGMVQREEREPGDTPSLSVPVAVTKRRGKIPNTPQHSSRRAEKMENGVTSPEEETKQRPGWLAKRKRTNPQLPKANEYGPGRPRPSERLRKRNVAWIA